jgi:hypothetical protein
MLSELKALFPFSPYAEVSKVLQGVHFLLDTLHQDKLVNGHVSRNQALDAVTQLLQNEKVDLAPVVPVVPAAVVPPTVA